ncbi:hypothetical protein RPMA_05690 [Tardiphaga alba]|uniref:Uncharacterized protein n=1 Tax=Tardiphaga alba TaxID=340268 RepID=A0ABX8A404_9BRAD|nr:hypothetical protein [Tardiphaga alba]QUS38394.1 hypothetical protein RPMA_05690 [Tardiphaga alba]
MPSRASHLPHYVERAALQKLRATPGLPAPNLMPAGPKTISKMAAKGWIELQGGMRYCITPAGEAALKAEIPMPRSPHTRTR